MAMHQKNTGVQANYLPIDCRCKAFLDQRLQIYRRWQTAGGKAGVTSL
jgi:hypothetical protein